MSNKILNSLVILFITNVFIINNSYACTVNNLTQVTGPFGSINTALANASTGPQLDTIEFSGKCIETVVINFPVTLQGNGGTLTAPAPKSKSNAIEIHTAGLTTLCLPTWCT